MGEEDVKRQALNVFRMELLGAKVEAVTDGSRVLKDAVNAALRSWVANIDDTHLYPWFCLWGLILSQKSFVTSKVSSVEKLNNSTVT